MLPYLLGPAYLPNILTGRLDNLHRPLLFSRPCCLDKLSHLGLQQIPIAMAKEVVLASTVSPSKDKAWQRGSEAKKSNRRLYGRWCMHSLKPVRSEPKSQKL